MKKGKNNIKQSSTPIRKILIPLLSKKEDQPEFIERIVSEKGEITLLLVIDTGAMVGGFGFATSEIATGNALMQKTKLGLAKRKRSCNEVMEWGDTANKIEHFAQLQQVNKIFIVRQENQFFKNLLKEMRENLQGIEIETVAVTDE